MNLIAEVTSNLVLVKPGSVAQETAWRGHGQLVWRDIESTGHQCNAREVVVSAGTYSLVRVKNPFKISGEPWLVIEGSRVGAAESHWRKLLAGSRGVRIRKVAEVESLLADGSASKEERKAA